MPSSRPARHSRRRRLLLVPLTAVGLAVTAMAAPGAQAGPQAAPAAVADPDDLVSEFLGAEPDLADADERAGSVSPSAAQKDAVRALGATVRWNRFGTPQSLLPGDGYLATGLAGSPTAVARGWLRSHAAIFRLSAAEVDALDLVSVQPMPQSSGRAVLFRQSLAGRPAAVDGMVTVGVADNSIAYVSSSLAGETDAAGAPSIDATQAWLGAAADLGRDVTDGDVSDVRTQHGWTVFRVDGFAQLQRARLRSLPAPDGDTRTVWEVNVVDVGGDTTLGFTSFVDAATGDVLVRQDRVDHAATGSMLAPSSEYTDTFSGTITATDCGPRHPFTVDDATATIVFSASADVPANDIVIRLYDPSGTVVASQDTGTSPEIQVYNGPIVNGEYEVEVCPFDNTPLVGTGDYTGTFTASEQQAEAIGYPPKWKYFLANPVLDFAPDQTTDSRRTGCWESRVDGADVPDCDNPPSDLINSAARGPWDFDFRTQTPTFTTTGNAAVTAEAWVNPPTVVFGNITPGAFGQRPFHSDRVYDDPFTDTWNNQRCDPATLTPGGNDILASVTHLFATHNRMHDFSYFLGFTESNYNLQDSNFGNAGQPLDPEVGNVQSGAITGGAPLYGGRDNANQLTLQDGVPGITNQYLFQPIAGAFYAPCVDGDFDFGVVGHEYTHAISNRMVGGPDSGLSGFQAGSMGESWSDQVAAEYLLAHNYKPGVSPFVEGAYATGNKQTGIRNYRLDDNPLQFGDLGYDVTGPEVHADGEPWSAVNIDIRQALVRKYNAQFPASNAALQRRCAQGNTFADPPADPLPATQCPGNRRWVQLMFDAFLLQQPATSMLDARDAMLSADVMRFGAANQKVLWHEFANNGFGARATTQGTEDDQPTPDYTSPREAEGTLRISANEYTNAGAGAAVDGTLYVGDYEARVTPVADTDPGTPLPRTVQMVPGTYDFVFQADGYGLLRFDETITAGQVTDRNVHLAVNVASSAKGATVDGASAGVNTSKLIDDTEASNWAGTNPAGVSVDTPAAHPFVNVNLAGGKQVVRSVRVSALLRPADPAQDEDPNQPDDESGSRFTALRDFAIATCTSSATSVCSSVLPADVPGSPYTTIYDSTEGRTARQAAFDSTAPRPLAPDLLLQRFDVPDTQATHVRLVALENQCSGTPEFAGEQDNDPANATDCKTASDRDESVRASELEVFEFDPSVRPPGDPVVALRMSGPATATPGQRVTYDLDYTNLGPKPARDAVLTDALPAGLGFVRASGEAGDPAPVLTQGTVRWDVGTLAVNESGGAELVTRVKAGTLGAVLNSAQLTAPLTFSAPAAAVTVVGPTGG